MRNNNISPLCNLDEGDRGEIVEIECSKPDPHRGRRRGRCMENRRMGDMGLRVGKKVQLLRKQNHGPLLLKVDDSRIAIGRALADKIWVRNGS